MTEKLRTELIEISKLIGMMERERLNALLDRLAQHPTNLAIRHETCNPNLLKDLTLINYISNLAEIKNSLKLRMN